MWKKEKERTDWGELEGALSAFNSVSVGFDTGEPEACIALDISGYPRRIPVTVLFPFLLRRSSIQSERRVASMGVGIMHFNFELCEERELDPGEWPENFELGEGGVSFEVGEVLGEAVGEFGGNLPRMGIHGMSSSWNSFGMCLKVRYSFFQSGYQRMRTVRPRGWKDVNICISRRRVVVVDEQGKNGGRRAGRGGAKEGVGAKIWEENQERQKITQTYLIKIDYSHSLQRPLLPPFRFLLFLLKFYQPQFPPQIRRTHIGSVYPEYSQVLFELLLGNGIGILIIRRRGEATLSTPTRRKFGAIFSIFIDGGDRRRCGWARYVGGPGELWHGVLDGSEGSVVIAESRCECDGSICSVWGEVERGLAGRGAGEGVWI